MTIQSTRRDPWGDDRLDAAFVARALRTRMPPDLVETTRMMLVTVPTTATLWRRLLVPAAVLVLAVGTLGGGITLLGDRTGAGTFRDGPSDGLKTFDNGEFTFDYPAAWLGYDSSAAFSGGSSIAVLGTEPVEPRCGDERHVDINCVYEQRLDRGHMRVFVGTAAYRSGTVFDRADINSGTSTRLTIDGMPAILDAFDPRPDSYYREDLLVHWSIARPTTNGTNIVRIEAMLREPGVAVGRTQLEALVASFEFTPSALPSPSDWWADRTAVGLPTISVSEAIAIRDGGRDDREIAVHGWFPPLPPVECPAPSEASISPVQPVCPDQFVWLTEEREPLTTVEANGMSSRPPTGPAVSPDLDDLDAGWMPALPDLGPGFGVEVVFVGHFDDRRSRLCPDAEEDACRARLVVDRVDWVNGETRPTNLVDAFEGDQASTLDEVRAIVDNEAPGSQLLSVAIVPGPVGVGRIEPSLGTGQSGLIDQRAIWVVRMLEGDRSVTYLVVDGTEAIFEMTEDGRAVDVGGTLPPPSTPPWPPRGADVVEMPFEVGPGRPPVRVAVVDQTGQLGDARAATSAEIAVRDITMNTVWTADLSDGRVLVDWGGSMCDDRLTLTISASDAGVPDRVTIDGRRGSPCRLRLVYYAVVLTFDPPVSTDKLAGSYLIGP